MEKLICSSCGSENLKEARFCASCGAALSEPKISACPQCGKEVSGEENFCPACGARIQGAVSAADFKRIPKTAPWVALGLVAAGLIFIFVFVSSQSRPPGEGSGNMPAASQGEPPLPQLSDEEVAKLPKDFAKLVEMGNHYFDHQQFHDAMVIYKKALEIDSTDFNVRTDYAAALNFMGDFAGAKRELEFVLAQNPKHAVATFNLGVVYINTGDHANARKYWNKYLELDPNSPRAGEVRKMLAELK
jgi:cytochrome c-type biogenesis protein CcmH/NrfG